MAPVTHDLRIFGAVTRPDSRPAVTPSPPLGVARWPALVMLALLGPAVAAGAQDLIPGAFTPVPVGINVVTLGANISHGDVAFDPALPVEDGRATVTAAAIGFNRTMNILGRAGSIGLGVPYMYGHLDGLLDGQFQEVFRSGLGDMSGRIAINLLGARAMTRQEFATYRPATILGISLVVGAPTGEYFPAKLINLGTNRWSFRPELGFSRRRNRWTFESNIAGTFFTDNQNFQGRIRHQAPILGLQGHLIYTFRQGLWLAGDGNFWKGGRLRTNGIESTVEQQNARLGLTFAVPVQRQQIRIAYSFGAYTTVGGDFHSVGVSYSYAWAARPRP